MSVKSYTLQRHQNTQRENPKNRGKSEHFNLGHRLLCHHPRRRNPQHRHHGHLLPSHPPPKAHRSNEISKFISFSNKR